MRIHRIVNESMKLAKQVKVTPLAGAKSAAQRTYNLIKFMANDLPS